MSDWFRDTRIDWIFETIQIYGYVNRKHIMRKFDVSVVQASIDLRQAQEQRPHLIAYNKTTKRYEYRGELK